MKKKLLVLTLAMMTTAAMCTACGEAKAETGTDTTAVSENIETEISESLDQASNESVDVDDSELFYGEDEEVGVCPMNAFEERTGKTSFESYDEIIGLLEGDEAYTYVNVKGYDGQVLMIADFAYDFGDGTLVTTEATLYSMKPSGVCSGDSIIYSSSTAAPIAIDDEGIIYSTSHRSVEKQCYGNNGTDTPAVMYLLSVYADSIDEDGNFINIGGFIRTTNDLVNDDLTDIAEDDTEALINAFKEYENAHVICFTNVN